MPAPAHRPASALRHALLGLAGVLLLLRALVPAGWMPASEGGLFDLVICTSTGVEAVRGEVDGGSPAGDADGSLLHQPCAFAGMPAALPPPWQIAMPCCAVLPGLAWGYLPALAAALATGWALPPATGPPSGA